MKKLFLLVLSIPLIFACSSNDPVTILSGTALNLEEGYFVLNGPTGAKDTISIDDDNNFEFKINDIDKSSNYFIEFGQEFIWLKISPLHNIILNFDRSDFLNSVSFEGDAADINNYIVKKARSKKTKNPDVDIYKLPYNEYKAWVDNNRDAKNTLFSETNKVDARDNFWISEEANILYGWAQLLEMYPVYYKYYTKTEEVELPEDYESYKNELNLNKAEYLESRAYTSYVSGEVRKAANQKSKELDAADMPLLNLEIAGELISDKIVLNNFRVTYLKDQLSRTEISELKDAIDFLRANVSDKELIADFNKEHDAWLSLAAGRPGLDFVGRDLKGNDIRFSNFKGKYVYVDVWATWCGPCRYEIPFLKKLEKDYHKRNIVFLSYSIDSDKEAWLEFVPKEELEGVQIIGDNAWESELIKHYKIKGVPTFMFFDPEGKIVSVKMTRPSDNKTRETFDSYSDL